MAAVSVENITSTSSLDVLDMNEEELDALLDRELDKVSLSSSSPPVSPRPPHEEEDMCSPTDDTDFQNAWQTFEKSKRENLRALQSYEEEFSTLQKLQLFSNDSSEESLTTIKQVLDDVVRQVEESATSSQLLLEKSQERRLNLGQEKQKILKQQRHEELKRREAEEGLLAHQRQEAHRILQREKQLKLEKLAQEEQQQQNEAKRRLERQQKQQEAEALKAQEKIKLEQERIEREKREQAEFLLSLQKEMEEREKERLATLKHLELQRKRSLLQAQMKWKKLDSAILIQKLARSFLGKNAHKQRTTAVTMIQSSMRKLSGKLKRWKLRKKQKLDRQMVTEKSLMALEDGLAYFLRNWERENLAGMEKEDLLAHAVRSQEKRRAALEIQLMFEEDMAERKRNTYEKQRERLEQNLMMQEDQAEDRRRQQLQYEREQMVLEDKSAKRLKYEMTRDLSTAIIGNGSTIDCTSRKLSSLRDAQFSGSFPSKFRGAHNLFQEVKYTLPSCFFKHLSVIDLEGNQLESLKGIENCYVLKELTLSKNHLEFESLTLLKSLASLRKLDLSHNPIKTFVGNEVLADSGELVELVLAHCKLTELPQFIIQDNLQRLVLDHNEIRGYSLLHQTCSLPNLKSLWLCNNEFKQLRQRSAHTCPLLQDLNINGNPVTKVAGALLEHINLETIQAKQAKFGKREVMHLCKYLKKLVSINGDEGYKYNTFMEEIVLFQGCVRGAIKREKIRLVLEGMADDDEEEEFEQVNVDEFNMDDLSDDEDETKLLELEEQLRKEEAQKENSFPVTAQLEALYSAGAEKEAQGDSEVLETPVTTQLEEDARRQFLMKRQQVVAESGGLETPATTQLEEDARRQFLMKRQPQQVVSDHSDCKSGALETPVTTQLEEDARSQFLMRMEREQPPVDDHDEQRQHQEGGKLKVGPESSGTSFGDREEEETHLHGEWSFKNEKTAKLLEQRNNKLLRAQQQRKKKEKLADPVARYKHLMRKVRNQQQQGESTPRGGSGFSQNVRDKQMHAMKKRKKRMVVPAWVQPQL